MTESKSIKKILEEHLYNGLTWDTFLNVCNDNNIEICFEQNAEKSFIKLINKNKAEKKEKITKFSFLPTRFSNLPKLYPGKSILNSPSYKNNLSDFIEANKDRVICRSFDIEEDGTIYRVYLRKLERNRNKNGV